MRDRDAATTYRIVVRGELGPRFAQVFDNFTVECTNGTSTLVGDVRDHAELNGVLNLLTALGAAIVSVTSY